MYRVCDGWSNLPHRTHWSLQLLRPLPWILTSLEAGTTGDFLSTPCELRWEVGFLFSFQSIIQTAMFTTNVRACRRLAQPPTFWSAKVAWHTCVSTLCKCHDTNTRDNNIMAFVSISANAHHPRFLGENDDATYHNITLDHFSSEKTFVLLVVIHTFNPNCL